jgi:hypothetical protein
MAGRHRLERGRIFETSWKGRGAELNARRSLLAARQAAEKAALKEAQKRDRQALKERLGRFPNYDEWLRQKDAPQQADQWRHRQRVPAEVLGPTFEPPAKQDIRDFIGVVDRWKVHYQRAGAAGAHSFTDEGRRISIYEERRRASVLAALQLSAQKWGSFEVYGDDQFKRLCVELGAEHGFRITNPELQEQLSLERQRLERTARGDSPEPPPTRRAPPQSPRSRHAQPASPSLAPADVYRRHLADLVRDRSPVEPSRADATVALRMRATGHDQASIELAIREGAPQARPEERRDWDQYAKRAATFAFSLPGTRQHEQLRREHDRLLTIEGRGLPPERGPAGRG